MLYRPVYNGLSALAIIGSCHTDLTSKIEVELKLTRGLASFQLKAEEWGLDSKEVIDRGLMAFEGEVGEPEEGLPAVGTPLAFSAEQSLFIKPHPDLICQADRALDFVYPDQFEQADQTCISDSAANLFHIARIYDIDIDKLQQRASDLATAKGLTRGP